MFLPGDVLAIRILAHEPHFFFHLEGDDFFCLPEFLSLMQPAVGTALECDCFFSEDFFKLFFLVSVSEEIVGLTGEESATPIKAQSAEKVQ